MPIYSVAAELSSEQQQIIEQSKTSLEIAEVLYFQHPELRQEILDATPNQKELKAAIAKKINWREYACLEKDMTWTPELKTEVDDFWTNPENTKAPDCYKWSSEDSDNPSTTNPAQSVIYGAASARNQGKITEEEFNKIVEDVEAIGGEVFIPPTPPSGS